MGHIVWHLWASFQLICGCDPGAVKTGSGQKNGGKGHVPPWPLKATWTPFPPAFPLLFLTWNLIQTRLSPLGHLCSQSGQAEDSMQTLWKSSCHATPSTRGPSSKGPQTCSRSCSLASNIPSVTGNVCTRSLPFKARLLGWYIYHHHEIQGTLNARAGCRLVNPSAFQ